MLLINESLEEYQAKSREYLTSHQLRDFRRCPLIYRQKQLGLIKEEDYPAFAIGRAFHVLALEGRDAFHFHCVVGGPINPRTGKYYGDGTKAYAEWAAQQTRPVISVSQYELIERMAAAVKEHELASQLLSRGTPEGVVRAEYCRVLCQIRMDWFDDETGIIELKSCDDIDWFEHDARRYGYIYQLAFYHAIVKTVSTRSVPVHMIAVEKREPYRCGVWVVHDDVIDEARHENETAIAGIVYCRASNTWPTGYERCRVFDRL